MLEELIAIRARIDALIRSLQDDSAGAAATPQRPANPATPSGPVTTMPKDDTPSGGGGILGVMDLSDSLRDVYLRVLKSDGLSMHELKQDPVLRLEPALPTIVKTLVRQGHFERCEQDGVVKYRAKPGFRMKRAVGGEVWDLLS